MNKGGKMKKQILCWVLTGCCLFGVSALDLQLRDGTCLPDIQFVRPALRGITLITTDSYGKSYLVTVPFSAISVSSLYSLQQYLRKNSLPPWDSPDLNPPAYAASLSALDLYLRRYSVPRVIISGDTLYMRLGPPDEGLAD